MARYKIGLIAAVLISGCAQTPKDVMDNSTATRYALKNDPKTAAYCVARNAENAASYYATTVRPMDGGMEVIVRVPAADNTVIVIAHIRAEGAGSSAEVRAGQLFFKQESRLKEMLNGC